MFGFSSPKVPELAPEEVKTVMDSKEFVILLDVRTPGEYSRGAIANSINIPLDQLSNVQTTYPNKNQKMIVYCLSGSRSNQAVGNLVKLGYTNIFSMKGGLLTWRGKGLPVAQ